MSSDLMYTLFGKIERQENLISAAKFENPFSIADSLDLTKTKRSHDAGKNVKKLTLFF